MKKLLYLALVLVCGSAIGQTPSSTSCGNPQQPWYASGGHFYICNDGVPFQVDGGSAPTVSAYSIYGNNTNTSAAGSSLQSLIVGTPSITDTGIASQFTNGVTGYYQSLWQNTTACSTCSTALVLNNDLGTATTNYIEAGINSSTYSSGTGSLNAAGYGFVDTVSNDLAIGTQTANALHFSTNASATDAFQINSSNAPVFPGLTGFLYGNGSSAVTAVGTTGTGNVVLATSPTISTSVTVPVITTTGALTLQAQTANSNIYGNASVNNARGGGVSGGYGQTAISATSQADSTLYGNPLVRGNFSSSNGTHSQSIFEFGGEGGYDTNGNLVNVSGTTYGDRHIYLYDSFTSYSVFNYTPDIELASAVTTTSSNTVAFAGGALTASMVGSKIFGVGCGLPGTTFATYGTIATVTPGTGFTYTGTAVTTGATCNIYVTLPYILFAPTETVEFQKPIQFVQTTAPSASTCGSGTAAGSDNVFKVTGITAATACTVTFNQGIHAGVCTANASAAATPVYISSISLTAVTFGFAALTGTLYATCY